MLTAENTCEEVWDVSEQGYLYIICHLRGDFAFAGMFRKHASAWIGIWNVHSCMVYMQHRSITNNAASAFENFVLHVTLDALVCNSAHLEPSTDRERYDTARWDQSWDCVDVRRLRIWMRFPLLSLGEQWTALLLCKELALQIDQKWVSHRVRIPYLRSGSELKLLHSCRSS